MEQVKMSWLLLVLPLCAAVSAGPPEQVHISYGYQPSQMVVMWSTEEYGDSQVAYGPDPFQLDKRQNGTCWRFTEGNPQGLQYMHRVLLEVSRRQTSRLSSSKVTHPATPAGPGLWS